MTTSKRAALRSSGRTAALPADPSVAALLAGLVSILNAPRADTASQFSALLSTYIPHSALVTLAVDDVGHPQQQHGEANIVSCVSFAELVAIRSDLAGAELRRGEMLVAGEVRPALAAVADTGALLLLTDPASAQFDQLAFHLWQILALHLQQYPREAPPSYLVESRAVSSARTKALSELADQHSTTLESLLAVLRSRELDDRAARQTATNLAAEAMVHLRTATDRVREFSEEPVTTAFERLRTDLRPIVRYRDIGMQFVEPPVDGRALPSEVAHGARAVVRGAILALVDQPDVARVRVQWDCDGTNLLINVRDDGPGDLTTESVQLQPLRQRVLALNGQLTLTATPDWGSEMSVILPLDPPPVRTGDSSVRDLGPRELEVLEHLLTGQRNRMIATQLGISENTVKFHISKIFRKLGVSSRAEAAALVLEKRVPAPRS
jgi:DNA-binding NarL/FixJ family response regulator